MPGSLVGDVLVVDRKRQTVSAFPRLASVLGAFALVATLLGLVALLDIRHQRAVAQEFLDTGVATVADQVEVAVRYGKGGGYIDEVEVTFVVATERHVATLSNSLGDLEGNADGRHPPAAGTRYATPLRILYKPDDPSQVIALVDAEDFAAAAGTPSDIAGVVAIGGTTTVAVAAGWLAYSRLRSGEADPAERPGGGRRRRIGAELSGRHRRVDG
ncbi:hypothetical protein AB0F43_30975 [Kribbella sp. NPDC023972]|uniref:hypothetical protein n=1 Tax=Kribbella sp. NPDC023972 TaxID=3154795 RepID=UPI00340C1D87